MSLTMGQKDTQSWGKLLQLKTVIDTLHNKGEPQKDVNGL